MNNRFLKVTQLATIEYDTGISRLLPTVSYKGGDAGVVTRI